jgi:HEAT repeat protein
VLARLGEALADPEPWARYYACQALGKLQAHHSATAIMRLIDDGAGQVRVAAIEALSHLRSEAAFTALERAAASPEQDVRRAALIGLGLAGRAESLPLLAEQAASADAATRLVALSALSEFDAPEALAALKRAVDDDDENVSTAAIGFLGARRGSEATRILVGLLTRATLIGRAQLALLAPGEHRVAGLLSALQSADDEVAARLTGILARLNQPDATAALFEGMTLPNPAARKAAATTLVASGRPHTYAALHRLSQQDPDAEVRRVCTLLLAQ